MRTCLKIAVLLALMALDVLPASCDDRGFSVQGRVRTIDGGPIPPDVTVRLEKAQGVEVAKQFVGTNGKFEFSNLTGDLYRLVVTAEGYQTVRQDVDMHFLASRYPEIYLVPSGQKKPGSPPTSTMSATDLAAPKKARKEYEKGHRALQSKQVAEARAHLEKAVAEDPCYARAQTSLGVALSMQHEFAPAESAFRKSIECDGGFLEAYVQLAILLNVEGKYAESEVSLQQGLRRFPNEWQLHYQLGAAHKGLKDYQKTEEEYLRAQSLNPTALPPDFYLKLADVYLQQKEFDKAYTELQAYLRADPNGEFADDTKSLMKRLESAGVLRSAQGVQ